jgi:uncharacterized protein (TIGR03000 family)
VAKIPQARPEIDASLTLQVPADAKIYIDNKEKAGSGAVRKFVWKKLKTNQKITNCQIRISINRQGTILSKTTLISLNPGDKRTLQIEIEPPLIR